MKRARILLSAIAIVAIITGAFAFKAERFAGRNIRCPIADPPTNNHCELVNYRTTNPGGQSLVSFSCPGETFYFLNTTTTTQGGVTVTICTTTATTQVYPAINE